MRDEDKPFVLYRKGPYNFTIVPRGMKGWAQFFAWIVLLVPLSVWFVDYAATHGEGPGLIAGLAAFFGMALIWAIASIWWMKARAEVVDVQELLRLKREQERTQRGR